MCHVIQRRFIQFARARVWQARSIEKRWYHSSVTGNAVETYISYLRHKIDYGFQEQLLHTIRGVGYALRSPQ